MEKSKMMYIIGIFIYAFFSFLLVNMINNDQIPYISAYKQYALLVTGVFVLIIGLAFFKKLTS
jgi:hypothetical protein